MTFAVKFVVTASLVGIIFVGLPHLAGAASPGNTHVGTSALKKNTGIYNTAVGFHAMNTNASCTSAGTPSSCCTGSGTGTCGNSGSNNTALGSSVLLSNTTGDHNTAVGGDGALQSNTTGSDNTALGDEAGNYLTTGSNNIDIGSQVHGVAGESNTTRIGTGTTATFIAGIKGGNNNGGGQQIVTVDNNGQLGTVGGGAGSGGGCVPNPAASPRFVDNGDNTVTDHKTCLMWEKKTGTVGGSTDYNNPENVNNTYDWSASGTAPDGTAFTNFLPRVNGTLCSVDPCPALGAHSDWRMPSLQELETIVDLSASGCGSSSPCIDPTFGPTKTYLYWSSSTYAASPYNAWYVYFGGGAAYWEGKSFTDSVRAVRGGS
jgi:hypothetical protein